MVAVTICQPYADMICNRTKLLENRRWPIRHRGELVIHAGKSESFFNPVDPEHRELFDPARLGVIVGVVQVVDCFDLRIEKDLATCRYLDSKNTEGPYCWFLKLIAKLPRPIQCRGNRGLWPVPTTFENGIRDPLLAMR